MTTGSLPSRIVCLTEETTETPYLLGVRARDGWDRTPAVRDGHVYEIKSTIILQPGPASLGEGVRQLLARAAGVVVDPGLVATETPIDRDAR